MKVLIISNLFPNNQQPGRGLFNKQQFKELSKLCELKVIAPLPWFPKLKISNSRSHFAEVADKEIIDDIEVYHPRYFIVPKIGRSFYGFLFYLGIKNKVLELYENFKFDIILSTWAYPDAFASSIISKQLNVPLIVKVHGTDVNVTSKYLLRRIMMRSAFNQAKKIIAVSKSLKRKINEMGIEQNKIEVIQNGVNKNLFRKIDKVECRKVFSLDEAKKHVVYIGNLVPIKGIEYLIRAFKSISKDICLNVIGDGYLKNKLVEEIAKNNLSDQILLHGKRPHDEIPYWLNAADILCLPSLNEGCPNVLLESLACGTPVVATKVGGIPDILDSKEKGTIIEPADEQSLSNAIMEILNEEKEATVITENDTLSWKDNANKVYEILQSI